MLRFARYNSDTVNNSHGFTLIEVLIVSPLIILLIGVTIGYITSLTGESLKTRERVTMSGNTQSALDTIEESALTATKFAKQTTAIPNAVQDANDASTATPIVNFVAANGTNGTLIIKRPATTASPSNSSRNTILVPGPSAGCFDPAVGRPTYDITEVYFVKDSTLWKRTILENYGNYCSTPYQQGSCAPGVSNSTYCQAEDEKILENVSNLSVLYISPAGVSIEPNSSMFMNNGGYQKIAVTITTSKQVAGDSISSTMKLTVKSKNI